MKSVNPREVGVICRTYARKIHARALPTDPSFLKISVACGHIDTALESSYPSFVQMSASRPGAQMIDTSDPRSGVVKSETEGDQARIKRRKVALVRKRHLRAQGVDPAAALAVPPPAEKRKEEGEKEGVPRELIMWTVIALVGVFAFCMGSVLVLVWLVNRYDTSGTFTGTGTGGEGSSM